MTERASSPRGPAHCLNCGAPLGEPRPRFCGACGQETHVRAPRLGEFLQQFGGAYFATEGALWRTLGLLLFKPGELTARYLAGRRKHYVLPLRLYLSISLVVLLLVRVLGSGAVMAGSALMAVAGSFLTLSAFNAFFFNMANGRGWVCVALVVFASWRPGKALFGALLFAFFDALQLRLQQAGSGVLGLELPYQVYLMLPYVMAIVALVVMARRAQVPQALMKPYRAGER